MTWYSKILKTSAQFWGREGSGVLLVCTEDNTCLLLLRSNEVEQPGTWGIPGGAVKGDDLDNEVMVSSDDINPSEHMPEHITFESALSETSEEIGCVPANYTRHGTSVYTKGGFKYTTYILDIDAKEKRRISSSIRLNWENSRWKWFNMNQLPDGLNFGVSYTVRKSPGLFGVKNVTT